MFDKIEPTMSKINLITVGSILSNIIYKTIRYNPNKKI